jgi:hypothetical protein
MTDRIGRSRLSVRLCVTLLVAAGLSVLAIGSVTAGDDSWVFRRSYFSHILPPDVQAHYPIPESRSAYRLPLVDVYPGFSVQGVERYNTIIMDHGNDVMIYRQFWVQAKP